MKIIEWLRKGWKNFKFELNLSTPEEIEERFKPKVKDMNEYKFNITDPKEVTTKPPEVKLIRGKGEEQKQENNETFERETKEKIGNIDFRLKLMHTNQVNDRERLKRLDEKLTEVVKMLMDVKDKL